MRATGSLSDPLLIRDDGPAADVVHGDGRIASIEGIVILYDMPYRDQRFGDNTQIILTFQT